MTEKLKPCPFCGEAPEAVPPPNMTIRCINYHCVAAEKGDPCYDFDTLAFRWNNRPGEDAARKDEREACARMVKTEGRAPLKTIRRILDVSGIAAASPTMAGKVRSEIAGCLVTIATKIRARGKADD